VTANRLRIAIDARELLGRPTGVGRYLAELLARWTRDPSLSTCALELHTPRPLNTGTGWAGEGGASVSVEVVHGPSGTIWEQWHLRRSLAARAPSVFFAPAYTMPLVLDVPRVVSIHDVSFAAHPEWFPRRQAWRRRVVTRASARRACRVLTLTRFSRDEIVAHLGVRTDKVRVIAPAVDAHPALSSPAVSGGADAGAREPLLLYVGSIFNRRHVPATMAAFARAAAQVPGARFEIVGENRTFPHEPLEPAMTASGAADRVVVRDYVDEATLHALFARARAFVFLSEYEGFGLTPLEAMSRGVPAVVLDTAVAREAYGDGAVYVSRPDAPELAASIARLLRDDAWHAERAAAGRLAAQRYSWDRAARETFDALATCAR
jgi:glycosyltransferase involved in cell wall biosynthesis